MNITKGLGIKVTCPSIERLNKLTQLDEDLDVKSELVEIVFKLVQVAAADHPELEEDVTKAELLLQHERDCIADMHKEIERLIR